MLNREWQNAIWREYLIEDGLALNAASIPVTVVPIFEPKVNGNTLSIDTRPRPTRGVRVDMKTDELWITIVRKQPSWNIF